MDINERERWRLGDAGDVKGNREGRPGESQAFDVQHERARLTAHRTASTNALTNAERRRWLGLVARPTRPSIEFPFGFLFPIGRVRAYPSMRSVGLSLNRSRPV
jgi:hypothetical protein